MEPRISSDEGANDTMPLKLQSAAALLLVAVLSCMRQTPDWYKHQEPGLEMPPFGGHAQVIDGATLQALRIAADDFIPPAARTRTCGESQASYLYRIVRQGNIIFVEIERDPTACGGQGHALDGSGRYAISKDGRILRRVLDGDGTNVWPEDAGTWTVLPTTPDGWPIVDDTANVDPRYLPPWQLVDGGLPELGASGSPREPDAGAAPVPDAGLASEPDAGVENRVDAGMIVEPRAEAVPVLDGGTPLDAGTPETRVSTPASKVKSSAGKQRPRKVKRRHARASDAGTPPALPAAPVQGGPPEGQK